MDRAHCELYRRLADLWRGRRAAELEEWEEENAAELLKEYSQREAPPEYGEFVRREFARFHSDEWERRHGRRLAAP